MPDGWSTGRVTGSDMESGEAKANGVVREKLERAIKATAFNARRNEWIMEGMAICVQRRKVEYMRLALEEFEALKL